MKTAIELLNITKAALTHETWRQAQPEGFPMSCTCLALALSASDEYKPEGNLEKTKARIAIFTVIKGEAPGKEENQHAVMWKFNDAPGRTLEEVHAKIDEAIALLKADASK